MKSNCNKCIHTKMCKFTGLNTDELLKDLKGKYEFIDEIEYSCKYFEKASLEPKVKESKGLESKTNTKEPKLTLPTETKERKKKEIKQTVIEDGLKETSKSVQRRTKIQKESKDEEFGNLSVFTMGFDNDTEKEFNTLGINTMKDVYALKHRISDESRKKINDKLEVFNQKKI